MRSEITSPLAIRRPVASASSKSASWASGKCEPKTSADVGAVARQQPHEALRGAAGVGGVGHLGLLGQRARGEPVEQLQAHRADHRDLRIVHVGVDEAREQEAVAAVEYLGVGVGGGDVGMGPGGEDRSVLERDRAVVEGLQRAARQERIARRVGHASSDDGRHRVPLCRISYPSVGTRMAPPRSRVKAVAASPRRAASVGRSDPVQSRGRGGDAQRRDREAVRARHGDRHAADALLVFLVIDRVAALAHQCELRGERVGCGDRARGRAGKSLGSGPSANASSALPAAHQCAGTRWPTWVNRRTARELGGLLEVDREVAFEDDEVGRLVDVVAHVAQVRLGRGAQPRAALVRRPGERDDLVASR